MSLLFDVAPDEPKKTRKAAPTPPAEPAPVVPAYSVPLVAAAPLGRTEDMHVCPDAGCESGYHEIVEEHGGFWKLECLFCGTGQRVKAIRGYLKPQTGGYVFPSGDYAGMPLDAVWVDERGRGYVEWAAAEHPREAVRLACKKHLDSLAVVH